MHSPGTAYGLSIPPPSSEDPRSLEGAGPAGAVHDPVVARASAHGIVPFPAQEPVLARQGTIFEIGSSRMSLAPAAFNRGMSRLIRALSTTVSMA